MFGKFEMLLLTLVGNNMSLYTPRDSAIRAVFQQMIYMEFIISVNLRKLSFYFIGYSNNGPNFKYFFTLLSVLKFHMVVVTNNLWFYKIHEHELPSNICFCIMAIKKSENYQEQMSSGAERPIIIVFFASVVNTRKTAFIRNKGCLLEIR